MVNIHYNHYFRIMFFTFLLYYLKLSSGSGFWTNIKIYKGFSSNFTLHIYHIYALSSRCTFFPNRFGNLTITCKRRTLFL